MLYGYQDGTSLIVVGADEPVQFEVFKTGIAADLDASFVEGFEIMMDPRHAGFKMALVFDATSQTGVDKLIGDLGVSMVSRQQALDLQAKMLLMEADDPFDPKNTRTIEEIYNIEGDEDTWDTRTDDEKARDALKINLEAIRAKQEAGEITTESFAPKQGKNGLANVMNIEAHYDEDGNLVIDGVTAEKGLFDHGDDEVDLGGEAGNAGTARPWTPEYDTSQFITDVSNPDAFKGLQASEFVFAVSEGDPFGSGTRTAFVRMAPKSYFDANSSLYENSLWPMVRHLIARDSTEEDESTFGHANMTAAEAQATYAALGFAQDQAFVDFLNGEIDARANKAAAKGRAPKNEPRFIDANSADPSKARNTKVGQGPEFTDEAEAARAAEAAQEEDAYTGPVEFNIDASADLTFLSRFLRALNADADAILSKMAGGHVMEIEDHRLASILSVAFRRRGIDFKALADNEPFEVDDYSLTAIEKGPISVFFKIDLPWARLEDIYDAIVATGQEYEKVVMTAGETMDGAWLACPVLRVAERVEGMIINALPTQETEVFGINPAGERLVPKGMNASVIDETEEREIGPRLWNAEAAKLDTMTEEEIAENNKNLKADEFFFTGHDELRGSTVYITPRSYFEEHGDMWEGELPDAAKRHVPSSFKEVSPGVYKAPMDYKTATAELVKRGMRQSMKLRIYLN